MLRALLERYTRHDDIVIDGEVYMRRYHLLASRWLSLRVHHIRLPDAGRHLHDHPFDFITTVLFGAYWEAFPDATSVLHRRGCVRFRQAEVAHAITDVPVGGAWTFVVTGPRRREWGFYVDGEWIHEHNYHVTEMS